MKMKYEQLGPYVLEQQSLLRSAAVRVEEDLRVSGKKATGARPGAVSPSKAQLAAAAQREARRVRAILAEYAASPTRNDPAMAAAVVALPRRDAAPFCRPPPALVMHRWGYESKEETRARAAAVARRKRRGSDARLAAEITTRERAAVSRADAWRMRPSSATRESARFACCGGAHSHAAQAHPITPQASSVPATTLPPAMSPSPPSQPAVDRGSPPSGAPRRADIEQLFPIRRQRAEYEAALRAAVPVAHSAREALQAAEAEAAEAEARLDVAKAAAAPLKAAAAPRAMATARLSQRQKAAAGRAALAAAQRVDTTHAEAVNATTAVATARDRLSVAERALARASSGVAAARAAAIAAASRRVRAWEVPQDAAAAGDDDATEVCGGGRGVDHPSFLHALHALADAQAAAALPAAEMRTRARALELSQTLAREDVHGAASWRQLTLADTFDSIARTQVARCEYEGALPSASAAKSIRDEHPAFCADRYGDDEDNGAGAHPSRAAALSSQLALLERCGRAGSRAPQRARLAQATALAIRECGSGGDCNLVSVWREALVQHRPHVLSEAQKRFKETAVSHRPAVCWFNSQPK